MKARRLDEVLDECLSAYLEGRRSVDESLSLYPALRHELEPLLWTAVEVADTFNQSSPPEHVEERGRQEFLTSASVRQRAKLLTYDLNFAQRLGELARRPRRLLIVAAFVIGLAVAGTIASRLELSSDETSEEAASVPSPLTPAVGGLRDAQQQLWRRANQGVDVSPEMIRALARTTTVLDSQVGDFSALDSQARLELERAIADQYLLLHLIANTQPAPTAPEARRALGVTQQVARSWGIDLPQVPPAAPASPVTPVDGTATSQPSSPTPFSSQGNETPSAETPTPESGANTSP
ncbi:MAG: hypothetical protein E6I09_07150 [Chloroflexi bacterium]|jgi:hypothetical protein|nr:MAG: hypothetical protein E6I09_07150 [Chloroflexota bacterium]